MLTVRPSSIRTKESFANGTVCFGAGNSEICAPKMGLHVVLAILFHPPHALCFPTVSLAESKWPSL